MDCLQEREEKTEDVERMKTRPKNGNWSSKRTDRVCTTTSYSAPIPLKFNSF